jgi:hypothetical protein
MKMLTIVCASSETLKSWPSFFFGCDDETIKQDFCDFVGFGNLTNWHRTFEEIVDGREPETLLRNVSEPCRSKSVFWWRSFTDSEVLEPGKSDNESKLSRQELMDMCNFNIQSGHSFKCEFAAKTYLWLCMNRSKISSITFN